MPKLSDVIIKRIKEKPEDLGLYFDLFSFCRETDDHTTTFTLRELLSAQIVKINDESILEWNDLYNRTLLYDSHHSFDCYMLYLESGREPEERFYYPRRKTLLPIVHALEKLYRREIKEFFLSLPPRVGKTSLLAFYITWVIGLNPENPNLYSSYSGIITGNFYNAVLEIVTDKSTYKFADIFPDCPLVKTNAADTTLDFGRAKHYPSLTARSLFGTLNGSCDADNGIIISDDLFSGIEEALSIERSNTTYYHVTNNLIPRGKSTTAYIWVGTRWSLHDPIGRRLDLFHYNDEFKDRPYMDINIPALDENDESNFNYLFNKGFDTKTYRELRATFESHGDIASWLAQYQGQPVDRDGALFSPKILRFYNGELPEHEPDRIFAACDPAFGGGDFTSFPVCFQYDNDVYVHDVVFSNGNKSVTIPLLGHMIEKYGVHSVSLELTKATDSYMVELSKYLDSLGVKCRLTSKAASTLKSKEDRIYYNSPNIIDNFIFRNDNSRSSDYNLFMQNLYSFKPTGGNKHDDAPDSLSMVADYIFKPNNSIKIMQRPF